ncbi:MAG: FimV/HubP family polar landmark protein [Pseudomonadota bacterium]
MKKTILKIGLIICFFATAGVAADEQTYGPVQKSESLYRIASQFRQKGVTMPQMMMSIYEANPDAFVQQNINRLKVGSVLKIPDVSVVASMDAKQAYNETTSHIDVFEKEVLEVKVEQGEAEPLSIVPRDPDLAPLVEITELNQTEVTEIKQELEQEQEAQKIEEILASGQLPEPKGVTTKRRAKPKRPLFNYSYDAALISDDNIRLAQDDDDIREDIILSATVKAKGGKSLDSHTIWNYGGSATINKFDTFDGLDNTEIEANTRYRFALSSGFTSPIYTLGARIAGLEFDTEMRDSTVISLSADMNLWLTTIVNMTAGLGFKDRESKSETYDTTETRLFVNLDTEISKTDLIYTTLTYITGDTVSSAEPTLDIINASDSIEPDDAFGGVDSNQFAYRIDSETFVLTLGYNKIFSRDLSMDISLRLVDTEAKDDSNIGYDRTIIRASLLGRF